MGIGVPSDIVPAGQIVHGLPSFAYSKGAQSKHDAEFSFEYFPSGHTSHPSKLRGMSSPVHVTSANVGDPLYPARQVGNTEHSMLSVDLIAHVGKLYPVGALGPDTGSLHVYTYSIRLLSVVSVTWTKLFPTRSSPSIVKVIAPSLFGLFVIRYEHVQFVPSPSASASTAYIDPMEFPPTLKEQLVFSIVSDDVKVNLIISSFLIYPSN